MQGEKPVVDDSQQQQQQQTPKAQNPDQLNEEELNQFMNMLEGYDVQTPAQLEGKLQASKDVGHVTNLLGQERAKNEDLQRRILALEQGQSQSTQKRGIDNLDDYGEGETINLEEVVRKSVRAEVQDAIQGERQQNAKQQQWQAYTWNKIVNDKDYSKVQPIWEEKMKDPNFVYQIQNGMLDPVEEYRGMVNTYKDGLLQQSFQTLKKLKDGGTIPNVPHVEQGGRAPENLINAQQQQGQNPVMARVAQLKAKADSGKLLDENEEMELAMLMMTEGTPIMDPGRLAPPPAEGTIDFGNEPVMFKKPK